MYQSKIIYNIMIYSKEKCQMRLHENSQLINRIRNKEIKQNIEQNIGLNFGSQNNEQLNMNRMDFIPNKHIKIIPKKKKHPEYKKKTLIKNTIIQAKILKWANQM